MSGCAQQGRFVAERKTMIDRAHRLSISGQARLLGISRGSVSYQRQPSSPADLTLMRQLDELHVEYPFAGSRMLRGLLRPKGSIVGRLHVATLMKQMGIMALYRRPATSHPTPGRHPRKYTPVNARLCTHKRLFIARAYPTISPQPPQCI